MIKRPDSHIKETKSFSYLQNVWADWAVNKLNEDYGVDLDVTIFENNEITDIRFPAQLKSTDKLKIKNGSISFSIDTDHLNYFFCHSLPFLFILYDNQKETAYWLIIQEYIWDFLEKNTPNWRVQKYNTLYIQIKNKIEDKNDLKEAISKAGNRIIQEKWYKLSVGEGLGLNENLENIEKLEKFEATAEKKINETKLRLSNLLIHQGDIKKANNKLQEVYNQNKHDSMHLKSIIGLASQLNIADDKQNKKLVDYCIEGIKLAKELKETSAELILILSKNRALSIGLTEKIGKLLYSKKVSSQSEFGKLNLNFIDSKFENITKEFISLAEELNEALEQLIKNEEYYLLIYFLAGTLDISSILIQKYKIFDAEDKSIEEEISNKMGLSKHLLNVLSVFNDDELEITVKSSVSWFYYISQKEEESLNLMKSALDVSIKSDNKPQIERISKLVEIIKNTPNLYKNSKPLESLTDNEYQDLMK